MKSLKDHGFFPFLASLLLIAGCMQPAAPDYRGLESLTISKMGFNDSRVSALVKLYNPNHFKLQLKRADLNITAEDKFIGHCVIDSTINVPRLDSFYIPVSVNVDLKNIFSDAVRLLLKGRIKVNADGYVSLRKTAITFRIPVHFEQYERADSLLEQLR